MLNPTLPLEQKVFTAQVGTEFQLQLPETTVTLQLVEAKELASPSISDRVPFALLFQGPASTMLAQATYPLEHTTLGSLHLFLVPIGLQDGNCLYEAIFN